MKIYQQIAVICLALGLLGAMVSYGVEGAQPAETYRKQISAAELFSLGQKHAAGWEVEQDDEEAAYYYRKAAEQGNARAQISLGMMYANGRGVQKDFDKAIYWILQASGLAQLGWHDTSVVEAVSWLQQASEHGYEPARRTLELMHDSGKQDVANSNNQVFRLGKSVDVRSIMAQSRFRNS